VSAAALIVSVAAALIALALYRLTRDQVEDQKRTNHAYRAAIITATTGANGPDGQRRYFKFKVSNAGSGPAWHLRVWLQLADSATSSSEVEELGALRAGSDPLEVTLYTALGLGAGVTRPGHLRASWTDGNGEHPDEVLREIELYI
jgi:hypothetical protein